MHSVGYPAWHPAADFFAEGRAVPYWTPQEAGEKRRWTAEGGFTR